MSSAVYFSDVDRTVQARDGETIYETARRGAVRIVGACGGRGTCGSCMVRVNGSRKWERACQLKADGEVSVKIAPRSLARVVRAEAEGGHEVLLLDSAIETRQIAPTAPSLSNPVADDDNAAAGLTMMPEAARALSETLRACGWQAELRLRDGQLIDAVEPGRPLLALAVDLGTTNVAGFLIDLRTGERVSGVGIENPQVGWGADVIARINAAVKDRQAEADLTATIR
ncbi:MAG: 2Fe-2S iron-sulfur cluster binding domain-containing protein, partial [Alphaproteobacteria bacterium]|nr:2Fe-2S iron-sulfur cluster binding domain-containing protein [Alphaproteobacteria bacterium]